MYLVLFKESVLGTYSVEQWSYSVSSHISKGGWVANKLTIRSTEKFKTLITCWATNYYLEKYKFSPFNFEYMYIILFEYIALLLKEINTVYKKWPRSSSLLKCLSSWSVIFKDIDVKMGENLIDFKHVLKLQANQVYSIKKNHF